MNKIKTEIQTITPKLAEYMLGKNMQNRNVSQSHVEKLSSDIKSGRWIFNGDPIRFNGNKLIDGQHRLSAVIKANKPIKSLVVYGLESKAIQTIDTGKSRSLSCTLGIDGYSNTPALASAIRTLNDYLRGSMDPQTISTSRGIELLEENPGLPEVVKRMESLRKGVSPISIGVISALHYLMQKCCLHEF